MPRRKPGHEIQRTPHNESGNSWTISSRVNPVEVAATIQFLQKTFPGYPMKTISQITATVFKFVASIATEDGIELMETEDAMDFLSFHRYGRFAALDNLRMRNYAKEKRYSIEKAPIQPVEDPTWARYDTLKAEGKSEEEIILILRQEGANI